MTEAEYEYKNVNNCMILLNEEGNTIVKKSENENILDFCYKNMNCSQIEIVNIEYPYILICDEEGLFKDNYLNVEATFLYKSFLVGDVLVAKLKDDDIAFMTEEECENFISFYFPPFEIR